MYTIAANVAEEVIAEGAKGEEENDCEFCQWFFTIVKLCTYLVKILVVVPIKTKILSFKVLPALQESLFIYDCH